MNKVELNKEDFDDYDNKMRASSALYADCAIEIDRMIEKYGNYIVRRSPEIERNKIIQEIANLAIVSNIAYERNVYWSKEHPTSYNKQIGIDTWPNWAKSLYYTIIDERLTIAITSFLIKAIFFITVFSASVIYLYQNKSVFGM